MKNNRESVKHLADVFEKIKSGKWSELFNEARGYAEDMLQLGIAGVLVFSTMAFDRGPVETIPPAKDKNCVNSEEVNLPDFDPVNDTIGMNSRSDVSVYDANDKKISRWYDVQPDDNKICFDDDGLMSIIYSGVKLGAPIYWTYAKDGVVVEVGGFDPK